MQVECVISFSTGPQVLLYMQVEFLNHLLAGKVPASLSQNIPFSSQVCYHLLQTRDGLLVIIMAS